MPTVRVRRRRDRQPEISPTQWALLTDQPPPEGNLHDSFEAWCFRWEHDGPPPWGQKTGRQLWVEHGKAIVAEWIADHPGTRPSCWWKYEAPGPRVRCGGIGTPSHERLANVERLHLGVPMDWITRGISETYVRLGSDLGVPPLDPRNPPLYEAQATFLDRYGMLLPGERRRLSAADFKPEPITDILDFGDAV
jgi:hypothetical protein